MSSGRQLITVERSSSHAQAVLTPDFGNVTAARHICRDTLTDWGLDDLVDDVELCVCELVTNAVVHAATSTTMLIHRQADGVVVEVRDQLAEPLELPGLADPNDADALANVDDLLAALEANGLLSALEANGRGLPLVRSIADNLAVDVDSTGKTVWFSVGVTDLADDQDARQGDTSVAANATSGMAGGAKPGRLVDMPVRVVLANVANVDDLFIELQLTEHRDSAADPGDSLLRVRDRLLDALRRSAPIRLRGRAAARRAAAHGEPRMSTDVVLTATGADELRHLNALLAEASELCVRGELLALAPTHDLLAFRQWCADELQRQWLGAAPTPCPLT